MSVRDSFWTSEGRRDERGVTESTVLSAALAWLEASDRPIAHGPDIATDMTAAEHSNQRFWGFAAQPSRGSL